MKRTHIIVDVLFLVFCLSLDMVEVCFEGLPVVSWQVSKHEQKKWLRLLHLAGEEPQKAQLVKLQKTTNSSQSLNSD